MLGRYQGFIISILMQEYHVSNNRLKSENEHHIP